MATFMWVDDRFAEHVKSKVEYDKNVLKKIKRHMPNADLYPSCEKATGEIYEQFIKPKRLSKGKNKRRKKNDSII